MDINKLTVINNIVLDTGSTVGATINGLIYVNGNTYVSSGYQQITKSSLIANNTFSSNVSVNVNSMGIYYYHLASNCQIATYSLCNVSIADNKAITNGAITCMAINIFKQGSCNPYAFLGIPHLNITNCIFYNPYNASVNSIQQPNGSNMSIQATTTLNPQFVSATDHHLQLTSPATNAGVFAGLPDDIDFMPIVSPLGSFPDIGCYEMNQPTNTLVATAGVSNATVCAGTSVTFTNTTLNTKNRYWTSLPAGTSSYANTFTISTLTAGTYTVNLMVADSSNAIGTSSFVITALSVPSITATASPTAACYGQNLTLSVASSNTVSSYLWFNAATSASIVLTPSVSGYYSVTAQNSYSCSATTSVYVTVTAASVTPSSYQVCPGLSVTLTATPSSTASTYLWFNGATTPSIVVTPTVPNSYPSYSVIVQDVCSKAGNITINVYPSAPQSATITASSNNLCLGQSFTLSTTTSSLAAWYYWSNGIVLQYPQSIIVTPSVSGTYSLDVKNSNGCSSPSNLININVFSLSNPTISPSSYSICAGQNFTFNAVSTNSVSSYLWSNGATTQSIIISPLISGTYTVTVQNSYSCLAQASIYVDVYLCTNLKTNSMKEGLSVYPNPNSGIFIIENNSNTIKYEVLDVLGQLLFEGEMDKGKKEIDLRTDIKGIYLIKIKEPNSIITTKRIIVE